MLIVMVTTAAADTTSLPNVRSSPEAFVTMLCENVAPLVVIVALEPIAGVLTTATAVSAQLTKLVESNVTESVRAPTTVATAVVKSHRNKYSPASGIFTVS
jgi:hypothetical protein